MSTIKKRKLILFAIVALLVLVLDQYTKYLSVIYLKGKESINLISGVLELQYLENRGAAFGLFQGQKILILLAGVVFLIAVMICIVKLPEEKKYNTLYIIAGTMTAGALGNMIDRIRLDYVIDFIYFSLIDFPIFNVADIAVTTSVIVLVFYILFIYKEDDFEFLNFKRKKNGDTK